VDPFAMPNWRKVLYSLLFFFMVAAAEMGNIIGMATQILNIQFKNMAF
jgi:hypothetical protein